VQKIHCRKGFPQLSPKSRTFFSRINRKTIWIVAVILILAAAGGYTYYSKSTLAAQASDGSEAQTAVARRGNLVLSASGKGTLLAGTAATFGFETSGQVTDVYVNVGDEVEAGQLLAQLDNTLAQMEYAEAQQALQELHSPTAIGTIQKEIGTAKDTEYYAREWLEYLISPEVVEAEENLRIAEGKLAEAQADAEANPSEEAKQNVEEQEGAVAFLSEKLDQARAYYENEYLLENFGQYEWVGGRRNRREVLVTYIDPETGEELPEIDEPSADDIAIARNNYVQAQETVKEGEIYLEVLRTGVIPEGATGEKLKTLYEAQVALENARSAIEELQLIAPIRGTVTSLDLNVGEQVDTSSIITISQLSQPYTLDAYLDENDWAIAAQAGNKVDVTFDLLPEQTFPGAVTMVYPELDTSFESALVHIVVDLDQRISQDLPAGTGASVDVVGGEARGVLLVPVSAVHDSDGGTFVTVLQNGEQVEREVEIGLQNDSYAEIKSGLEAGEIVAAE